MADRLIEIRHLGRAMDRRAALQAMDQARLNALYVIADDEGFSTADMARARGVEWSTVKSVLSAFQAIFSGEGKVPARTPDFSQVPERLIEKVSEKSP